MRRLTYLALAAATTALVPFAASAQTSNPAPDSSATAQQRQAAQQNQNVQGGATVEQMRNKPLYTQAGQEVGRINNVVRDRQGQTFVIIDTRNNQQALAPIGRFAYENDRFVLTGVSGNELRLPNYTQQSASEYQPVEASARVTVAGYETADQNRQQAQQSADATQVLVQQPAPRVQINPGTPQVNVQQAQPQVNVRQPQPEIIVRQAPPTITVQQPQPEIIVRMPQPDVNVSMARPQVDVRMPQPQVRTATGEQAQVMVQQDRTPEAQVNVQRQQEAQVNVQRAQQPQVRYERTGEPQVRYNQEQGQPNIRYEQMGQEQASAQDVRRQPVAAQNQSVEQRTTNLRERVGLLDADQTAALPRSGVRNLTIREIEDMDVYNARGEELGDIDRIIQGTDGQRYAILEHGGFLGLGEQKVAIPVARLQMRGDRLVVPGLTEQEIEGMTNWERRFPNAREIGDNDRLEVGVYQ